MPEPFVFESGGLSRVCEMAMILCFRESEGLTLENLTIHCLPLVILELKLSTLGNLSIIHRCIHLETNHHS